MMGAFALAVVGVSTPASAVRFVYFYGHGLDEGRLAARGDSKVAELTPDDAGWNSAMDIVEAGGADFILLGESYPGYSLSSTTHARLMSHINAGGRIVALGAHGSEVGWLNATFGYSLTAGAFDASGAYIADKSPSAAGTQYANGPASLASLNLSIYVHGAPAGSVRYENTNPGASGGVAVFEDFIGQGSLTYYGWDYCCGGTEEQIDAWYDVLHIGFLGCQGDDTDGDGMKDNCDNCVDISNPPQGDCDSDGIGDACETAVDYTGDADSDGVLNGCDNCLDVVNPGQEDCNQDGVGDACATGDTDGDGVPDSCDNCVNDANPAQTDCDSDGVGDTCEQDDDMDGTPNECDSCPVDVANDADGDGRCESVDNCPTTHNASQKDTDVDGLGDACDTDLDGDGVDNTIDNCPKDANPSQSDSDGDGRGDACLGASFTLTGHGSFDCYDEFWSYLGSDYSGTVTFAVEYDTQAAPDYNYNDYYYYDYSEWYGIAQDISFSSTFGSFELPATATNFQTLQYQGYYAGYENSNYLYSWFSGGYWYLQGPDVIENGHTLPEDPSNYAYSDYSYSAYLSANGVTCYFNGYGPLEIDAATPVDSDGDGVPDGSDQCPGFNDNADADGDGAADGCDSCPLDDENDSDADGHCGDVDECPGFDDHADADGDGTADGCDACPLDASNDSDGDGSCDSADACPLDANNDADGDAICGNVDACPLDADNDADGDAICGNVDACPLDFFNDADGDAICGNVDTCPNGNNNYDIDGDGAPDACDACPYDMANDADGDGICGDVDACPLDAANDADGDGLCANADPCPADAANDADQDSICGDVDPCPADAANDADGDGFCESDDNCDSVSNPNQSNVDGDGYGDACEPDNDGDGTVDDLDNCPLDANAGQLDTDLDGIGDICDADDDGDGVIDGIDTCLNTLPAEPVLSNGCSWAQQCVCTAAWKNHGGYVSCVAHATNSLRAAGLITDAQKSAIQSAAGQSSCGKKK